MKIIFVRHADHTDNKLTRTGKKQAKLVCHELAYENIGRVYVSPCKRAVLTVQIITKRLNLPRATICQDLAERKSLSGKPQNAKEEDFFNNYLNPNFSMDSPEGCKEFLARSFRVLDKIIAENKGAESVLIIGHSSFAYALNAYFCGIADGKDITWLRLGNCSKICYETK